MCLYLYLSNIFMVYGQAICLCLSCSSVFACRRHQLGQQSHQPGYHTDMFKKRPNDQTFRLRGICKSHSELYCAVSHWLNYLHQNKISAVWNVRRKSNGFDQKSIYLLQHLGWFFKIKHMDKPIMQFHKIFSMWLFHFIKWAQHTFDINFWWFGCVGKTLGSNFSIKFSHIVSFESSWDNDYCFVTFCKTEQFQKITNFLLKITNPLTQGQFEWKWFL